jgi:hypothetical protein
MSDASAVVDRAAAAVEASDAKDTGKNVPESKEVKATKKATVGKYAAAEKAQAKRAVALRGKARTAGPVQVLRVRDALGKRDPLKVLDMPISKAKAYAGGDKSVKPSASLVAFSEGMADPFCKGRGAAALLLALAGK